MPLRKHSHGPRSIPHKRPYVVCIGFVLLHFLSVIAAATFAYLLYETREETIAWWLVGSIAAVGATWLMTFIARRCARCPLCQGTPLLDTSATKHHKARRLRPLNHGTSAQLGLIVTQRFRCMYCGTPYDLHRDPRRDRSAHPAES